MTLIIASDKDTYQFGIMNYEFGIGHGVGWMSNCNTAGISMNFFVLDFEPSLCTSLVKLWIMNSELWITKFEGFNDWMELIATPQVSLWTFLSWTSHLLYVLKSPPCSKCLCGKIMNYEFSPCVTNVTEIPFQIIYLCGK